VWHKELGRYNVRVNGICPRARTRLTEGLMAPRQEGEFDALDPANVSPFVAYLLSDACTFSGQVFIVGGGLVQRAAPWTLDAGWKLEQGSRWTLDGLEKAIDALGAPTNAGRDTGFVR
jgi:NAD(P)-dependent dehydrogenase (short-subunit alcohol dehydrogenase family)